MLKVTQEIILSAFFKILVRKANVNSGIKMEMMMWSVSSHCKRLSIDGDCVWVDDVTTESASPRPAGTWSAPRVQQVVVPFAWPVWLPFGPFCVTWSFTVRYTALTLNNITNRTSMGPWVFSVWPSVTCCLPMLALSYENSDNPCFICTSCVLIDVLF